MAGNLAIAITPLSSTIVFGESISFVSAVTGALNASNVTYQWKKGGVNLTGTGNQSANYVHTPSGVGADVITCVATESGNDLSPATSNSVTITILSIYTTLASVNSYLAKIAAAI